MPILSHEQRIFNLGFEFFRNEGMGKIPPFNSYDTEIWMRGFKSAERIELRQAATRNPDDWTHAQYWIRRDAIDAALAELSE